MGGANVLIAAIYELAARDVIRDLLRLPQLPGQWPLPCRDHRKGERINILPLGRVVNCQVLSHRVSLVIGPDLLLVRVYPCMGRETRFPPVPPGADGADPGIICPGSEMTRARVLHAAVRVEAPGEVRPGQEGAQGGATLLHDLDPEPDPFTLLP